MSGTRYVNMRTQNIVETRNEGPASFTIVTVTDDGYGPSRRVPSTSFHKNFLAESGQPYTTGYVPLRTLPGDHPFAMNVEIDRMELLDHLDDLSTAELADLIAKEQRVMADAKALIERAKAVAKSRRAKEGLELHGGVAMVFTSGEKFDAKTAARNLTPAELLSISVPKPDAERARRVFEDQPDRLKACLKDNGFTLTVREATEKDRLAALEAAAASNDIEVFELDD